MSENSTAAGTPPDPTTSPNTNKRSPAHKSADALFIEQQHLRGKGVREIAEMLSKMRPYTLSHAQVALDLKKLRQSWMKEAVHLVGVEKEKALRKLDMLESELWTEWDKSKALKTRTTLTKKSKGAKTGATGDAAGEEVKSAVQTVSVGDASIARTIIEIHRERSKLLGLDAPTRSELSGPGGGPIPTANVPLDHATQEALLRRHFERMKEDEAEAQQATANDSQSTATPNTA